MTFASSSRHNTPEQASRRSVVSIGELVVDWLSTSKGSGFSESSTFLKSLGGNGANVAIALARLGTPSKVLAKVGADVPGKYLIEVLQREGVDASSVIIDPNLATAACYVFSTAADDHTFLNWPPGNASHQLMLTDIRDEHFAGAAVAHSTGISLTREPRRTAALGALKRAKELQLIVSFDASYPTGQGSGIANPMEHAIAISDIIKVNLVELFFWARFIGLPMSREDLDFIRVYEEPPCSGNESMTQQALPEISDDRIEDFANRLFDAFNAHILIVTMGARGSLIITKKGASSKPIYKVNSRSGVGAGDAFIAGFLHGLLSCRTTSMPIEYLALLSPDELDYCHDYASAVAALATTHVSAWEGLPRHDDVQMLIKRQAANSSS